MAVPSLPHGGTSRTSATGGGGSVFGALPVLPILIRVGGVVVRGGRGAVTAVNRELNKTFLGRVSKKIGVGYGIDVGLDEIFDFQPGPGTKGAQVVWALIKGDYSGAIADMVDVWRRIGHQQQKGVFVIDAALPAALGRGFSDP